MNMNKFPVTSSMEYSDYDNTPNYTPSGIVVQPREDIFRQKPTDSLIKQSNNVVYPTNPTPVQVQQPNDKNGPQKPKLGWIDETEDINYPGKPIERFGQQPDVITYPLKPLNDLKHNSVDINNQTKPTDDPIQQSSGINYQRTPTVGFVEQSNNINLSRKPSIGFVEQSNDDNCPSKTSIGFNEQPNDINYHRKPSVCFVEQSNDDNCPRKPSIGFVEQPNDVNYHRKPSVGFVEQSNDDNCPRKPSIGFVEKPNNVHFTRNPSVGFVEQSNDIPFHRKKSIGFVEQANHVNNHQKRAVNFAEQPNEINYSRKPLTGFVQQSNGLAEHPNDLIDRSSTEDFSLNDTDASSPSEPTHVVLQQSRDIPFPSIPQNEVIKKSGSGKYPYAIKQSNDFFTQSNDVISHRKPSGINGKTPGRVTIHVDGDSRPERKSSCSKCGNCCKKTFAFLVSHIGLCSLVVGYSIAGGFIFRELESPFEVNERSNVELTRQKRVEELWNMTEVLNLLYKENWTIEADKVLLAFQMDVFRATKEKGWDGKDGDSNLQWSFAGSLLYSVTVITTIGYGHIAPKTPHGRLVTIFYALIGIPLTLLCLANLGRMFSDCFRFTFKYTCRCLKWTFLPSKPVFKRRAERKRNSSTRKRAKRQMREMERAEELIFSIEDQKQALEDEEEVRVPIVISMGVMALYIFGGAVLFMLWEDDWDYLIGSYFCFITLSTIGFGDFVPGASVDSWANQEKTILCTLYLVFGLSLIAMCFNLMQEEVKLKFRWLAAKLNIIDDHKNKR